MDEHLEAAPPLIVSGATGGGKTDIVLRVAGAQSIPHAYFICSGYSSSKQLLRSLWYTMMLSIFENVLCHIMLRVLQVLKIAGEFA